MRGDASWRWVFFLRDSRQRSSRREPIEQPARTDDFHTGAAHAVMESAIGRYEDYWISGCSRDSSQGVISLARCVNDLDAVDNASVDAAAGGSFDHHDHRERELVGDCGDANPLGELASSTGSIAPPSRGT